MHGYQWSQTNYFFSVWNYPTITQSDELAIDQQVITKASGYEIDFATFCPNSCFLHKMTISIATLDAAAAVHGFDYDGFICDAQLLFTATTTTMTACNVGNCHHAQLQSSSDSYLS